MVATWNQYTNIHMRHNVFPVKTLSRKNHQACCCYWCKIITPTILHQYVLLSTHSQEAPTPFDFLLSLASRKHQIPLFVEAYLAYLKRHVRHRPRRYFARTNLQLLGFFQTNLQEAPTPKLSQAPTRDGSTNFLYAGTNPHFNRN